jgi:hypothetical protein
MILFSIIFIRSLYWKAPFLLSKIIYNLYLFQNSLKLSSPYLSVTQRGKLFRFRFLFLTSYRVLTLSSGSALLRIR